MSKTKLKIHTWPEGILRKKCKKVQNVDDSIRETLDSMLSLMRKSQGVGLAANQVGIDLRLIVVELGKEVYKLVNPQITKKEGSIFFAEGCLSFPNLELTLLRSRRVNILALDELGNPIKLELEEPLSVVFQHEIDHINGITFYDRAPIAQKIKAFPKLRKIIKETKNRLRK